jgi:hypothetical protein
MPTITYTPIAKRVITSPTTTVTFSNIPSTYTDLVVVCSLIGISTGQGFRYQVGTSGTIDTGNNYSYTWISGKGTGSPNTASNRVSTTNQGQIGWAWQGSSENLSVVTANFQNYSNTTTFKSSIGRTSDVTKEVSAIVNLWRSTNAITDLRLFPSNGYTMAAGSTLTLYGIKAGS